MRSCFPIATALAIAGCKKTAEPPTSAAIEVAPGSTWKASHPGDAPMIEGPDGVFVFVTTSRSQDRMPGIAFGSSRGPDLALLAGVFAPLLVPDRTDHAHQVRIAATGSTLSIDFEDAFSARTLVKADRIRIAVRGRANLVLPSGKTVVKGFRSGRPSFAETVAAWSEASLEVHEVDRLEIATERRGTIVVESDCAPRLIRPRARANTSSFLLRVGPPRRDFDSTYAPENAADGAPACIGTATISFGRP